MNHSARITAQMQIARNFTQQVLASFETPEQWVYQIFPGANHALWFVGHMVTVDNFMLGWRDPKLSFDRPDLAALFSRASQPTNRPADYPPAKELLELMNERRAKLLGVVEKMSNEELAQPKPEGGPQFLTDWASVFEMLAWHEGLHAGQISMVRRALGHPPVFG